MTSRIEKLLKAYAEGKGGDIVDGEAPSRIEAILEEIIENRPFYEEEGAEVETVLMEKTLLELLENAESGDMGLIPNASMEAGKEYTVTINGVSRSYTAQSFTETGDDGVTMTATYIGDGFEVMDGEVEPTEGFIYLDVKAMGVAMAYPTSEELFSKNFNVDFTNPESLVNLMVKVSGMEKGVYIKQISGKFVEDMYYTEKVENPKVYVEDLSVDTSSGNIERIDFGGRGLRIVEIDGELYECEVLEVAPENGIIYTMMGNIALFDDGAEDNGQPFVFINVAHGIYPYTLVTFADSIEGTVTVTIRDPDEIVHKVPAKYLPPMEFNSKEIDARIAALEDTIGELNDALENTLNGGS